jgi:hypothetical protein
VTRANPPPGWCAAADHHGGLKDDNVRYYHLCEADVPRIESFGIGAAVTRRKEFEII